MWIKAFVIALLVFIVLNLFRALPMLLKHNHQGSMAKALGWRVGLSFLLLLGVIIAIALGWIEPNPRPY